MVKEFKKLALPHINSFNYFLETLPILISRIPPQEITDSKNRLLVYVSDFSITMPFLKNKEYLSMDRRLMPRECRNKMVSYKGTATIKFNFVLNGELVHTEERKDGDFPIMVKSKLCHLKDKKAKKNIFYQEIPKKSQLILENKNLLENKQNFVYGDPLEENEELGGYFIINGLEKMFRFLIVQKRNFIFAQKKPSLSKKGKNLTENFVTMRCVSKDEIASVISLHYSNDGNIFIRVFIKKSEYFVPLILVLKGLTQISDKEIYHKIIKESKNELLKNRTLIFLRRSLENKLKIKEEEKREIDESEYLGSIFKKVFYESTLTNKEAAVKLFDFIASHLENYTDKVNFLIEGVKKLFLLVNGEINEDSSDDPSNQEVIGINHLLSFIVKEKLTENLRNLNFFYQKKKFELTVSSVKNLAKKIEATVCQRIESFLATGNYNTYACSDVKQEKGFIVAAERLNILRFISHFRVINRGSFFTTVKTTTVRKLRPESFGFLCPVHTPDGTPCGILNHLALDATVIYKKDSFDEKVLLDYGVSHFSYGLPVFLDGKLMGYSSSEELPSFLRKERKKAEIAFLPKEGIFIFTNVGRFSREIFNKKSKKVENIGIMEQMHLDFQNEYSEKNRTSFLSLTASLTPFSDYNQSPRNVYQCQMAKQSMGIPVHSLKYRTDVKSYVHFYNQMPIVQTETYSKFRMHRYPLGVNTIIAVLSYTAYDMEDACVINKSSMERGIFKGFVYKTETIQLEKNQILLETVEEGTFLSPNAFFYSFVEGNEKKSKFFHGMEGGFVEKVIFTDKVISVKLRIERNPNIGDKFCSRHGQKGVCSFHYPSVDLPFSESGLVPDIIINPHAFPSRMTIGMMIESLAGKSGCLLGKVQDGTSFRKYDEKCDDSSVLIRMFGDELRKCGFNYYGNETMYSGITGTPFKTDIFMGVVYYQRLRHMVNDKFQIRINGPVQPQTKQPIKGRSKLGGVRLGEMERDALLAHGTSYIINDRFMNCSDGTLFFYCVECKDILFCKKEGCLCGNKIIKEIYLPYVYKYLCIELMAMNIRVKLE